MKNVFSSFLFHNVLSEDNAVLFLEVLTFSNASSYCMRVMMPEVPEGDWFCEECRTEMQIEKEKSILEKSQVKVSTISVGSKVKAANVSNKDLNVSNTSSKSTKEDAGIMTNLNQHLACILCIVFVLCK